MQDADDALKAKIRDIQRTHGYAIGFRDELGRLDVRPPGPDDPVPDLPGLPPRTGLSPLVLDLLATAGVKHRAGGKTAPLAEIVKISEAAREHSAPISEAFAPMPPAPPRRDPAAREAARDIPAIRRRARKGSHRR